MLQQAYGEDCLSRTQCHEWYTQSNKNPLGVIFRTSRSGSDVRCSCHHNLSRFSFPIFAHSWRFSVFHSLQSINTAYILNEIQQ